jgi:hypothetical protein|tara:strand:+ start:151 stop:411 length:261 start_codon:yes stop_codon:yes gene_type:complete
MKNLIRSEFIICRIDENYFLNDVELSFGEYGGLRKEKSNRVELIIYDTFDTKLECLEYLANNDKNIKDFIILEKYKLIKLKSKEDK